MASTSLTFVSERKEGLLDRSLVAGVNIIELMLSHTFVKLGILIIQAVIILFAMMLMLKLELNHLFIAAGLLILLQGLCGISFGNVVFDISRYKFHIKQLLLLRFFYIDIGTRRVRSTLIHCRRSFPSIDYFGYFVASRRHAKLVSNHVSLILAANQPIRTFIS